MAAGMGVQIAACDATVVSVEDVPAELLESERLIELQKEDLKSKPEKIRCAFASASSA